MVTDPVAGQKYWCISQPTESQQYGAHDPVAPWQGILVRTGRGAWQLCRIGSADLPCDDTNSSTYVTVAEIFHSRREALQEFIRQGTRYLQGLATQLTLMIQLVMKAQKELDSPEI